MMFVPKCSERDCRHWISFLDPTGKGNEGTVPFCEAFPKGIPYAIAWGDNLHTKPFPGDNGIQYEPEEED